MTPVLIAYFISAGTIALAEMGDKTQLLAMAFASKYKVSKVLTGVFIATVLNNAMAVAAGNILTRISGLQLWIEVIASLSFIFFGLWTIKGEKLDEEEKNGKTRFGVITTVAVAFFIAELGDKTQLAALALAVKFPLSPVAVLLGTTSGMMIADAVGIIVGAAMCRKIPERNIKLISGSAFILFGLIGSYEVAMNKLGFGMPLTLAIIAAMAVITVFLAFSIARKAEYGTCGSKGGAGKG